MTSGWERGDLLGHDVPADLEALRSGGVDFLTSAFRAAGSLGEGERVDAITELEPFAGGSTGRKATLGVTYAGAERVLPERLFVKFSRDLGDELRDRGKRQMEAEVRFALLSQIPDFPVAVPRVLFADFHLGSGTGLLISERIPFGDDGIEPHHAKARDHEIDDPLEHYEALLDAMARLAGAHRAGRFPAAVMARFEHGATKVAARERKPTTAEQVHERVERYAAFAARHPHLLPESIRSDRFLALLRSEVWRSVEHADALRAALRDGAEAHLAFCHWNANIDNAWFWREPGGVLACGLLDWGNVGQIDLVTALSSALVFAEPDLLLEHLGHLFARFASTLEQAGGGPLDAAGLERRFALQMVSGGLQWPLAAVPLLERHEAALAAAADRFDPAIVDDELVRTQLHMLTSYLLLWQRSDPAAVIDRATADRP